MDARICTEEGRFLARGAFDRDRMVFSIERDDGRAFKWVGARIKVEDPHTGKAIVHCRVVSKSGADIYLESISQ